MSNKPKEPIREAKHGNTHIFEDLANVSYKFKTKSVRALSAFSFFSGQSNAYLYYLCRDWLYDFDIYSVVFVTTWFEASGYTYLWAQ